MGRLIDADSLKGKFGACMFKGDTIISIINEQYTVEAIPKDQYEARLKADMAAMLTDIQLDIEELKTDYDKNLTSEHDIYYAYDKSSRIVQNYINALKENKDED